jgi:hypothetical protein
MIQEYLNPGLRAFLDGQGSRRYEVKSKMQRASSYVPSGLLSGIAGSTGVISPLHSLAGKKANKRRKLVLTPDYVSYTAGGDSIASWGL